MVEYSESSKAKIILGAKKSAAIQKKRKQERIEKYNNNPKLCKNCQKALPYEKRRDTFCNKPCSATFNNKGIVRNGKRVTKTCSYCQSKLIQNKQKFCSTLCVKLFREKKYKDQVYKTGIMPSCKSGSTYSIKNFLIRERGVKCEICGITKWNGEPIPLVLDHINGNSYDNHLKNLRLVCGNCDMLLPTYKGRNKGKGRHSRRKRYAAGKSY